MSHTSRRTVTSLVIICLLCLVWGVYQSVKTSRVDGQVRAVLAAELEGLGYDAPRDKIEPMNSPPGTPDTYFTPAIHNPDTDSKMETSIEVLLNQNPNMPPFKIISVTVDSDSGVSAPQVTLDASARIAFSVFPGITRTTTVNTSFFIPKFKNATGSEHY